MRGKKFISFCNFCSWCLEHFGRHRIKASGFIRRLKAVPARVRKHSRNLVSSSGSIRVGLEQTVVHICELVPTPRRMEGGCVQPSLEGIKRLLFPTIQSKSILPDENPAGRSRASPSDPLLAESTLVPPRTGTINRHTPSSPTSSGPIDFSFGGESSSSTERLDQTSRLDALRRNFEERGLSEDAIALVLSATRTNTRTAYQSAWNAWRSWCCSREKDPLSAGIHDVLNFLADFQKGGSYRTVNVTRSMLSSTLPVNPVNGDGIGKDPLVCPPAPRYTTTWSPDTVLSYFDATANTDLSLLQLSHKAVTLVALCSLLRTCEIKSIQHESIQISDFGISFTLANPRKAQHSGPLQRISIDAWPRRVIFRENGALEEFVKIDYIIPQL